MATICPSTKSKAISCENTNGSISIENARVGYQDLKAGYVDTKWICRACCTTDDCYVDVSLSLLDTYKADCDGRQICVIEQHKAYFVSPCIGDTEPRNQAQQTDFQSIQYSCKYTASTICK